MRTCHILCVFSVTFWILIQDGDFSLEEDECSSMFLTQSSNMDKEKTGYGAILGDPMDFTSPCSSLITSRNTQYSDISDDDFDNFPLTQNDTDSAGDYHGLVFCCH